MIREHVAAFFLAFTIILALFVVLYGNPSNRRKP